MEIQRRTLSTSILFLFLTLLSTTTALEARAQAPGGPAVPVPHPVPHAAPAARPRAGKTVTIDSRIRITLDGFADRTSRDTFQTAARVSEDLSKALEANLHEICGFEIEDYSIFNDAVLVVGRAYCFLLETPGKVTLTDLDLRTALVTRIAPGFEFPIVPIDPPPPPGGVTVHNR